MGASSMGWTEAAEAWGAEVEAVVVDIPDQFKDIRRKVSLTPTTTPQDGLRLLPLGPWDGCLLATIATASETQLITALFKRWRPAIAILSIHSSFSRRDTIEMLPAGLPLFYHKKMMTFRHSAIGGVSTSSWRFIHYTRWGDVISYPSLMTSENLPRFLQTALSDTLGGVRGATFEPRSGLCIYRARAASYWHWHRGSRIFFWRFPKQFRSTMRDGTPFYHLADPPVGFAHNMPAPSREAEIET